MLGTTVLPMSHVRWLGTSLEGLLFGAYMFDDARLSDVFVGIDRTVEEVLKRVRPA